EPAGVSASGVGPWSSTALRGAGIARSVEKDIGALLCTTKSSAPTRAPLRRLRSGAAGPAAERFPHSAAGPLFEPQFVELAFEHSQTSAPDGPPQALRDSSPVRGMISGDDHPEGGTGRRVTASPRAGH